MEQRDFSKNFQLVYDKFIEHLAEHKKFPSLAELGRFLGHGHDGKVRAWKKGQWPSAEDCALIEKLLGFDLRWLVTGEGEPSGGAPPPVEVTKSESAPTPAPSSIPIAGFASCGMSGWNGCMTYPLAVPAPHMRPDMIAVMATGESMLPEGIGHGHICFCDPHVAPIPGECVYVTHRDKMATLKAFVGTVQMEGGTGYRLQGWQDKMNGEPQKHFYLDVLQSLVVTLAPVVYVQRRL